MNETVNWLIVVEATASDLYAKSAAVFREDEDFSRFLLLMSLEEKEHEQFLQRASLSISEEKMKKASFFVDEDFRRKVEAPFSRAWGLLEKGHLTKSAMVDVIAEAEFSEWNEIFIYVIDTLNNANDQLQKAVSEIDKHRAYVQQYISSLPDGDSFIQRVRRLSQPIRKRVLIVEDNHSVARMLEALAMDETEVIIARNGVEGIAHIQERRFDLIVSDIEMPKMNGIEMYKKALEIDASIYSRFIFFSGTEKAEYLDFVRTTNALMLPRPSTVKVICETMNEVLDSTAIPKDSTLH